MTRIGDLPLATAVRQDDVLVVHQGGLNQSVAQAALLPRYTNPSGISRKSSYFQRRISDTAYYVTIDDILVPTVLLLTSGSPVSVVLSSGLIPYLIGSQIAVIQMGAGQITFVAGGGATIRTASSLTTKAQYSRVEAVYDTQNEWHVFGDLT